jgi:hypothetical protein
VAAPHLSGHISLRLPSQNPKRWKSVESEVSNRHRCLRGASKSCLSLVYSGVFNQPCRPRSRGSRAGSRRRQVHSLTVGSITSAAFCECSPAKVGHADADWKRPSMRRWG